MNNFGASLAFTLGFEGGYVNDPDDAGGATNMGVTQRVYNAHREACGLPLQSVRLITKPEVENIYRNGYWKAAGCDDLRPKTAMAVFDTAVNFGVGRAKEFLGEIGGSLTDAEVAARIVAVRKAYRLKRVAQKPSQAKFLKGWLNRDNALGRAVA